MFEFYKNWKKKKHIGRIEAYKQLPGLLKQMDECNKNAVDKLANDPPFPQDEMQRRLGLVAEEFIKSQFPEIWIDIEKISNDFDIDVNDVASHVMSTCILPILMEKTSEMMEKTLKDIVDHCDKGINKELEEIEKLK
jgi:hypothetical protein